MQLFKTYFNDPARQLHVEAGTVLLKQNQFNDRLYLVIDGLLEGTMITDEGHEIQLFTATRHMFVGVYSFFFKIYSSSATVIAKQPTRLAYIDLQTVIDMGIEGCFADQFMPGVVSELVQRSLKIQEISSEKEQALKRLLQVEKMASLGQMAAGISHELNNAISVIQRNVEWLCNHLAPLIGSDNEKETRFLNMGKEQGYQWSSRETRTRIKQLQNRYQMADSAAEALSRTPLQIHEIEQADIEQAVPLSHYFSIGAACHDVKLAAEQSAHVVKSVRTLAAQQSDQSVIDINQVISDALILTQGGYRDIIVEKKLANVRPMTGMANYQDIRHAMDQASIDQYVEKPWEGDELRVIVRELITGYILQKDVDYEPFMPILHQVTLQELLKAR